MASYELFNGNQGKEPGAMCSVRMQSFYRKKYIINS